MPWVPDEPGVQVRPMFGNVAAFREREHVHGAVRVRSLGVESLTRPVSTRFVLRAGGHYGPPERAMNGWVSVPDSASADQVGAWVDAALAYVRTLPVKAAKQPRSRI